MKPRLVRSIYLSVLATLVIGFVIAVRRSAAEQLLLVIAASSPTPSGIAEKAKALAPRFKNGLVIQTSDCGEGHNVYAFASIENSRETAQAVLASTRAVVPDAYVRACTVKPDSLLAFRVPAVDSSIADVPSNAVNWREEDRVSSARALPDGRSLILIRYYAAAVDDPLEGRRERVELATATDKTTVLDEQCVGAGQAAVSAGRIAFDCAIEQAGDHLLHAVKAFDQSGHKVKEIQHCRNPRWEEKNLVTCEEESVGPDGKLALVPKRTEIP